MLERTRVLLAVLLVLAMVLVRGAEGSMCDEYDKACECKVHVDAKTVILHR